MTESSYELVPAASVTEWHDEADVLVVGFGAAGSCAAIEARGEGADVLVLERASGVSGTTCAATGHFYLGGGTRVQKANGIEDTVEDMFQYLMANTPEPEEEKIRLYCESSVSHFNWLVEQGVPFNDGFYRKKHFEQPTDECLIWSGNEKAWPFSEKAKPAPRGHKVEKVGGEGGGLVMHKLTARAEDLGVRFQFDARVRNLVADEGGARLRGALHPLQGGALRAGPSRCCTGRRRFRHEPGNAGTVLSPPGGAGRVQAGQSQ